MASPGCPKASPEAPRVFGVSLKDRSAILPAGRGADAAYWWDTKTGASSPAPTTSRAPAWVRDVQRAQARRRAGRRVVDRPARAGDAAPAAAGGAAARRSTTRSTAAPTATICCSISPSELLDREQLGKRNATDLLVGQLLVERFGRPHLWPGLAAGPRHRLRTDRDDRPAARTASTRRSACSTRWSRSPRDHGVAPVPETLRERSACPAAG